MATKRRRQAKGGRRQRRRNPRVYRRGSYRGDFFRVTVSSAEVFDFSQNWPGSGMADKDGFGAEFNADTGDLVDLDGWPATDEVNEVDQSALSALIDDMRDYGMRGRKKGQFWEEKPAGYRKRNPGGTTAQRAGAAWASAGIRKKREIIRRLGLDRWKYGNVTPNADFALLQSAALDMGLYNELEDELLGTGLGRTGNPTSIADAFKLLKCGETVVVGRGSRDKLTAMLESAGFGVSWEGRYGRYTMRARPRRRNPATRGRKRRKIVSQAQWRALAAKMNRGEISKRDFDDMVGQSRPFRRLPKRKGSRRRNPSERDINEVFEDLAGGPDRAFRIMRLSERAREAVSGDQFRLGRRPRSAKEVFKAMAKREGHPQKAVDYYARHFM